jgi:lipooligosaccharide transport system ATP-binding protein
MVCGVTRQGEGEGRKAATADQTDRLALSLQSVFKRYGEITAVDGLDLDVEPGICMGLLGPNGAGKSTTMRMLTAQTRADEGSIRVLGHPIPAESKHARARMGVVPQQDNLDIELSARQNLTVFAQLYRVPAGERDAAVQRALHLAQLTDRADTRTEKLSGGMRRRLLIARGLVHQPELVLLDEPTVGLDPQVRQELWVLMSTHYIEEAERLCDDVAIMSHGRIIARDKPRALLDSHAGKDAIEYYGPPQRLLEVERIAADAGLPTRRTGPAVSVLRAEDIPDDVAAALGPGLSRPSNLEDVFVLLTGETVE